MSIKRKIICAASAIVLSLALLVTTSILAEQAIITPISTMVLTLVCIIALIAAIFYAARLDHETGNYVCRNCGNTFKPTFGEYFLAPHSLTTRYLRCPKCQKKSWCKRITVKDISNDTIEK